MACLVLPVSILRRRSSAVGYQPLTEEPELGDLVTVVVGKEKREFLVEALVLEENPFRVLIDSGYAKIMRDKRVVFVDIDAILFEHMLWLMHNDSSELFQLNVREIIDFYAQDS
ncbi:hypothetical protein Dsin_030336 [Dipteronia sinensis]|uniref:Uncharacterized protein n=1 Tax=Dipteronia sinensis TaxID=43782 RepID=A0AAE0DSC4_9ROSI|nr:hypothetical protein Dsin_030336 [Dipteronia sinensis]